MGVSRVVVGGVVVAGLAASAVVARAELTTSINLTDEPFDIRPQAMDDSRWSAFFIGPQDKIELHPPDPSQAVTMARCGCLLTSMSTAIESMAVGSSPVFATKQFIGGKLEPVAALSPSTSTTS